MTNAQALLQDWGIAAHGVTLCNPQTLGLELQKFTLPEAERWFAVSGEFGADTEIWLSPAHLPVNHKIKLGITGPAQPKQNLKIALLGPAAGLQIFVGGNGCRVFVGASPRFNMHAVLWGGSTLAIGDQSTCNGARTIQNRSSLIIGRDCMLSDEVLLQGNHQHTLVDLTTMSAISQPDEVTLVGEHVWLGRRSVLMPGVHVGKGAVIAAGAVVTRDVMECAMAAGVPAEIIRVNASWCRNEQDRVDAAELAAAGITWPRG